MGIIENASQRTWNVSYLLACLIVVITIFILTLVFLYRTDYIESRGGSISQITTKNENKRKLVSKFSFIRTPIESVLSKVGWKYPAFRDQLQSSAGFFILYTIVTTLLVMVVVIAYPGNTNMKEILPSLNQSVLSNPIFAGFMFGHVVNVTNGANLEGFLLFKLLTFHWMYYGPFLFIGTYYVVMRDKNDKYDEITWSLPQSRSSVLISRTGATILYFWITIFINWLGLWATIPILATYMTITPPNVTATIITFIFLALGYSLFLILFIAIAVTVNSRYVIITLVGVFILAIFIPIVSYSTKTIWLDYLSPFKYFDVVGLLINQVNVVTTAIPTILIGGIIVLVIYIASIKVITPRKDIV